MWKWSPGMAWFPASSLSSPSNHPITTFTTFACAVFSFSQGLSLHRRSLPSVLLKRCSSLRCETPGCSMCCIEAEFNIELVMHDGNTAIPCPNPPPPDHAADQGCFSMHCAYFPAKFAWSPVVANCSSPAEICPITETCLRLTAIASFIGVGYTGTGTSTGTSLIYRS